MSVFIRVADFLPKNTQLMAFVKPSEDVNEELYKETIKQLKTKPSIKANSGGIYVPIYLDESLRIEFSISNAGKIHRKFKKCKCRSPVLPNEQLKSLSNAGQKISLLFEKNRLNNKIDVYNNICFQDKDDLWTELYILRERVYQPFEDEFEEHLRIFKEKINLYLKPIADITQILALEVKQKDAIIQLLRSQKQELQKRLENLNNLEVKQKDDIVQLLESQMQDLQKQLQDTNNLLEKSKLVTYRKKLDEFKDRLTMDLPETKSPDSWQEWIYKNNWLFGIQYGNFIAHPKVGFRSTLDYLFPTPDGFIDILEIKKPSHEVIKENKSNPGAFVWSREANEAIGQVVNYLYQIELHQLEISKQLKQEHSLELSTIKPRAFILIGQSDNWNEKQREAFRKLNHALHGIEVITYTDLLVRGENLIKVYGD
jgi:hypothetical protein